MSLEMPFGVYTINDADVDAKYRVLDDNARDSLIINKLVQVGFVIYHIVDNKRYWLKAYPTIGDLTGVVWEEVGSGSSVVFPENPNEGDTFINNTDYYLFENAEWLLISNVKIKTVFEQVFYIQNRLSTDFIGTNDIIMFGGRILDDNEFGERLKFSVVDFYKFTSENIKELVSKNNTFVDITSFAQSLMDSSDIDVDGYFVDNILAVFKEKIKEDETPQVTYSNGMYAMLKGRDFMTKNTYGLNININSIFENLSDFSNGNIGKYLMWHFWNIDTDNVDNSIFIFQRKLRTFYNQPTIGSTIGSDVNTQKTIYFYNDVTKVIEAGIIEFTIVNKPILFRTYKDSKSLEIVDFGGYLSGYEYYKGNFTMALVYPCKVVGEEKYCFYIKPYGVDQSKVVIPNSRETSSDDVYLTLDFKNNRRNFHKLVDNVVDDNATTFYKRFSLFNNLDKFFGKNINAEKVKSIKIFTYNKRTKTRSNYSNAQVNFNKGVNNAGTFIPKRY